MRTAEFQLSLLFLPGGPSQISFYLSAVGFLFLISELPPELEGGSAEGDQKGQREGTWMPKGRVPARDSSPVSVPSRCL